MKSTAMVSAAVCALILAGCANREGVAPSQNPSLQEVSPSTTATSEGGVMQRSLDAWLKEEWTPLTAPAAAPATPAERPDTNGSAAEEEPPFTLQHYIDKWKIYHENQDKRKEGEPETPSHAETIGTLPVIGE